MPCRERVSVLNPEGFPLLFVKLQPQLHSLVGIDHGGDGGKRLIGRLGQRGDGLHKGEQLIGLERYLQDVAGKLHIRRDGLARNEGKLDGGILDGIFPLHRLGLDFASEGTVGGECKGHGSGGNAQLG